MGEVYYLLELPTDGTVYLWLNWDIKENIMVLILDGTLWALSASLSETNFKFDTAVDDRKCLKQIKLYLYPSSRANCIPELPSDIRTMENIAVASNTESASRSHPINSRER